MSNHFFSKIYIRANWLINSLSVYIEMWHNVLQKDITPFLHLDIYLMNKILCVHSKVPVVLLYLETASIPINYILAGRRINYLHNKTTRPDHKLNKIVFKAQKLSKSKGEWSEILKEDIELIKFEISEA